MGDFGVHSIIGRARRGGMRSRVATAFVGGVVGRAGAPTFAHIPPPGPPLPPQRPPSQPPPPVQADDEDAPPYDPPPGYRRAPRPSNAPSPQYGRGYPQEVETNQLPPPTGYL